MGELIHIVFMFDGVKIMLLPSRQVLEKPKHVGDANALLSLAQFDEKLQESDIGYMLVGKEVADSIIIPEIVAPLITKFDDLFPEKLPDGFPRQRDI